jgi:hypothetical protein
MYLFSTVMVCGGALHAAEAGDASAEEQALLDAFYTTALAAEENFYSGYDVNGDPLWVAAIALNTQYADEHAFVDVVGESDGLIDHVREELMQALWNYIHYESSAIKCVKLLKSFFAMDRDFLGELCEQLSPSVLLFHKELFKRLFEVGTPIRNKIAMIESSLVS